MGISESTLMRARSVLSALGVMRGGCAHAMRPQLAPNEVAAVERIHRHAEPLRATAHFVQGCQRIITIEGGILNALRHHGRGQLLEVHGEHMALGPLGFVQAFRVLPEQYALEKIEGSFADGRVSPFGFANGTDNLLPVVRVNFCLIGLDVGAIDRKGS